MPLSHGRLIEKLEPFKATPWLDAPMPQILLSMYWPHSDKLSHQTTHTINLKNSDDKLILVENKGEGWQPGKRVIILVHGLTGCHLSSYNIRLANKLVTMGYLVIRVNLRGCGPGFGLAKSIYHRYVNHFCIQHNPIYP